jgi:hypothetical protein
MLPAHITIIVIRLAYSYLRIKIGTNDVKIQDIYSVLQTVLGFSVCVIIVNYELQYMYSNIIR